MTLNSKISEITGRIVKRSKHTRSTYLAAVNSQFREGPRRIRLTAGNLAHASAGCPLHDKSRILNASWPNIGIITAYNDMLSAHQPFGTYPDIIKQAARNVNATAQVAGGVPAMCDGVTQGQDGMELSLFSRDVISLSTAVALSHDTFDAVIHLGVCDKIVPGLVIGALKYGWIPSIFAPAGPMTSGLLNRDKARVRQLFAEGKVDRNTLLKAESESYHSPGTCTFYGTANTNQMLMEFMGLQLPGSSFVNPNTLLRKAITEKTTRRAAQITSMGDEFTPAAYIVNEKAIVNGLAGLMATGGSTNLAIHMMAMARAAGIIINWDDLADMSNVVPLICKVYPNGMADINHFHAAGGMAYLISELLSAGLVHDDVITVAGSGGLSSYTQEPFLEDGVVSYRDGPKSSGAPTIIATVDKPFRVDGGLALVSGNLGRGVSKISAVRDEHQFVQAPAIIFDDQDDLILAFQNNELERDFVAVIRFQGPAANGMPELHKLSPILGLLQDRGFRVALVTDGRMSGASGKVLSAIHMCPEALHGGPLSKLMDGDLITVDAVNGTVNVDLSEDELQRRKAVSSPDRENLAALGMNMFSVFREHSNNAELGGTILRNMPTTALLR